MTEDEVQINSAANRMAGKLHANKYEIEELLADAQELKRRVKELEAANAKLVREIPISKLSDEEKEPIPE